jgi:UDP-3-O-[3-hydroxymyristoyl] glucosamine N-acyltransferase
MLYLTKKIEEKIHCLADVIDCLVFVEDTVAIPSEIEKANAFIVCNDPASSYTEVAITLEELIVNENRKKRYVLTENNYIIGEDVVLGNNVAIEPGAFIDHDVKIGNNVLIKSGVRIRQNTLIGDDCVIGENTVIGEPAFNTATLSNGRFVVMPSFGGVRIGNNVFMGANNSISKGNADDTIIEDNVKIDSNVRIGHDVHLHRNVEIIGRAGIGGYCEIGEFTVVSGDTSLKNRINIGKHCFIGMGSIVHHDVRDNLTITGNPAISLEQTARKKVFEVKLRELLKKYNSSE